MQPKLIILDADGGSDDAWALLLLLKAEQKQQVSILGITICGCGNTDLQNAGRNMYRILQAWGRKDIPIYFGAAESLIPAVHTVDEDKFFHGKDGFGDILPLEVDIEQVKQQEHAVVAIDRICNEHSKEVTIIAVGPLTNIALAYAMYGARFANNVKQIYIMGGNHQGVGNVTRCAEFNFYADPEAAHIVLEKSKCPLTILPWEPCMEDRFFICLDWRLDEFGTAAATNCPAIDMLNKVERAQWLSSGFKGWIPCDALLVAAFLFDSQIIRKQSLWHATVNLNGCTRGQMVLDHMHEIHKFPKNVKIIELLNAEMFKNVVEWVAGIAEIRLDVEKCD